MRTHKVPTPLFHILDLIVYQMIKRENTFKNIHISLKNTNFCENKKRKKNWKLVVSKRRNHKLNIKSLQTLNNNSHETGYHLFLLRQKFREIR